MKLTSKCEQHFKKWLPNIDKDIFPLDFVGGNYIGTSVTITNVFEKLPLAMQYGVLVDFFLSVGIVIELNSVMHHKKGLVFVIFLTDLDTGFIDNYDLDYKPLTEARIKAIDKANELYNTK